MASAPSARSLSSLVVRVTRQIRALEAQAPVSAAAVHIARGPAASPRAAQARAVLASQWAAQRTLLAARALAERLWRVRLARARARPVTAVAAPRPARQTQLGASQGVTARVRGVAAQGRVTAQERVVAQERVAAGAQRERAALRPAQPAIRARSCRSGTPSPGVSITAVAIGSSSLPTPRPTAKKSLSSATTQPIRRLRQPCRRSEAQARCGWLSTKDTAVGRSNKTTTS